MKHYILGALLILTACQSVEETTQCYTAQGAHNYLQAIYAEGDTIPLNYPYQSPIQLLEAQTDLNNWLNNQETGSLASISIDVDRNIIIEVENTSIQFDSMQVGAMDAVNIIVAEFTFCE